MSNVAEPKGNYLYYLAELGGIFQDICVDVANWQIKTFGADETSSPLGPLKHMAKEVQEAIEHPLDGGEYADIFILLLGASRRAGFSQLDLLHEVEKKMKINKLREWGDKDADGVRYHVKTPQELAALEAHAAKAIAEEEAVVVERSGGTLESQLIGKSRFESGLPDWRDEVRELEGEGT